MFCESSGECKAALTIVLGDAIGLRRFGGRIVAAALPYQLYLMNRYHFDKIQGTITCRAM